MVLNLDLYAWIKPHRIALKTSTLFGTIFNKIEKVLLLNNINRYIVKSEHMEITSEMDTGMGGLKLT